MTQHWSTEEFAELCWHDVHVHGWRLENFDDVEGAADLILDIDYLLAWPREGSSVFLIAPANLRFHKAFGLRAEIDFAGPSAGMVPLSIQEISREPLAYPTGFQTFRWNIVLNWPRGGFTFEAPSFEQVLTGAPREKNGLWLTSGERGASVAA